MKTYFKTMIVFVFSFYFTSLSYAQQSDYQIKTDFNYEYAALSNALSNAQSVKIIDSLKSEIFNLDNEYFKYSGIIDNALYPSSYNSKFEELKSKANSIQQRLLIIENQTERLVKLYQEVSNYKSEIFFLNNRADSLRKAIDNSQTSEERLSTLIKRYRKNLELRDELIMDVVDSLMASYSGMKLDKLNEISENVETGRISGNNPLMMVKSVIEENIEYASAINHTLSVEDYLRMYSVQQHFEIVWNRIGDKMIMAYGGTKKGQWNAEIASRLKDWRMVTSQKMWNSMDDYLEFSDVELKAFDNNYSFFIALDSFVKEAKIKSKDEIIPSGSYQDYKRFQEFWSSKVKNEWSNTIQDTEMLTVDQISLIDEQLTSWESEARPIHPFLLVLLVLTVISIGGFMLVLLKSKKLN